MNFNTNKNLNFNRNNSRSNQYRVRPVLAYQEKERKSMIRLNEVYTAYRKCLKGKRDTVDALSFELHAERECVRLWREINDRTYQPSRSIVFISNYPVKREIFGAAFRDRVMETVVIQKITPYLEELFIDDNYSTRVGKGTLYGVRRVAEMVRECSENYTRDCEVMKLDVKSFFISLPKDLCYQRFEWFMRECYGGGDADTLLWLISLVIYNRPEQNCVRKSALRCWEGLPANKSLFLTDGTHGLPIGRGIVQITALLFLDELDHLLKEQLGVRYYGRYMDDMVFVSRSREELDRIRQFVADWLETRRMRLHPDKVYLQHYQKGVLFIGGMIKPGRVYLSKRTVTNGIRKLEAYNLKARLRGDDYVRRHTFRFVSTLNSYFGIASHYAAWNVSHRFVRHVSPPWWRRMRVRRIYNDRERDYRTTTSER